MNPAYQDLAIVIPSLEPTELLISYVEELIVQGFTHIYIVNDGSSAVYDYIFEATEKLEGCSLLTHPQNCGKGMALKTAYRHIEETFPQCRGLITVDSDGQHGISDVCRMGESLSQHPGKLLLGGRSFSGKGVPIKSLVGNRISTLMFFLLHGKWIEDTQTGLRAFDRSLLGEMLSIEGERFEYEMAVLSVCINKKIPVHTIGIHTIYLEANASTHFRPVADSLRIIAVLLAKLWRFMLSSGVACGVDMGLCWVLLHVLHAYIPSHLLRIALAVTGARLVSMLVNYSINKGFVFSQSSQNTHAFRRYVILALGNMLCATLMIYLGRSVFYIDERLAKLIADTILFIINYQLQRIWVFPAWDTGGTK